FQTLTLQGLGSPACFSLKQGANRTQFLQKLQCLFWIFHAVPRVRAFLGRTPGKEPLCPSGSRGGRECLPLTAHLSPGRAALQQVRDAASGRVGTVFQLYEEAAAELGLEAVVQRSALSPSLADALAWLQDVECYYRQAYLECKLLLLRAHHEDLSELEALPQAWEGLLERHNPDIVEGNWTASRWRVPGGVQSGVAGPRVWKLPQIVCAHTALPAGGCYCWLCTPPLGPGPNQLNSHFTLTA
uniref:AFG2 interacting ribosome maturation factor n=1 Tax=Crocodylus porosus TaxID=8502 RepID=A0A7M4E3F6_CROPO